MAAFDEFANRRVRKSIDGVPMAPSKVPVTPQELEEVEYTGTAQARVFWSDVEDDMAEYRKVLQGLMDMGNMRLARDLEQFVPERKAWVFCVRWAEVQGQIPADLRAMEKYFDQ